MEIQSKDPTNSSTPNKYLPKNVIDEESFFSRIYKNYFENIFGLCQVKRKNRAKVVDIYADKRTVPYEKMSKGIRIGFIGEKGQENYSKDLIALIHDTWVEISIAKYIEILKQFRESRRKLRSYTKILEYEKCIEEFSTKTESALNENLLFVLRDNQGDMNKFHMSCLYYQTQDPEWYHKISSAIEMLKLHLPKSTKKFITNKKISDIISFQIEEYQKIPITMDDLKDPEMLIFTKQIQLEDISFEKFNLEEEDYCPRGDQASAVSTKFRELAEKLRNIISEDIENCERNIKTAKRPKNNQNTDSQIYNENIDKSKNESQASKNLELPEIYDLSIEKDLVKKAQQGADYKKKIDSDKDKKNTYAVLENMLRDILKAKMAQSGEEINEKQLDEIIKTQINDIQNPKKK